MKVLDLPDNQDNPIRQILLKQDNNMLEELAKKSKNEIQSFLVSTKMKESRIKKIEKENVQIIEKQNQNSEQESHLIKEKNIEQKLSKIKSVFTPLILDKNPKIAKQFKSIE